MHEALFWTFTTASMAVFVVHTRNGVRRMRARNDRLKEFARRFGVLLPGPKAAPNPRIHKFLSASASYPNWIEGSYNGVRVVAFDYRIGWRSQVVGSGVGVDRVVLHPERLRLPSGRKLKATSLKGWTFLSAENGTFSPYRMMEAEEMEQLWQMLLMAPAEQLEIAEPLREPVPGGVHIRPRRLGLSR